MTSFAYLSHRSANLLPARRFQEAYPVCRRDIGASIAVAPHRSTPFSDLCVNMITKLVFYPLKSPWPTGEGYENTHERTHFHPA